MHRFAPVKVGLGTGVDKQIIFVGSYSDFKIYLILPSSHKAIEKAVIFSEQSLCARYAGSCVCTEAFVTVPKKSSHSVMEETSSEELPSSAWPVSTSGGHFLDW